MHKILVPMENFSTLSLSAAHFAVEFAKRNPTKILFLIFSPTPEGKETVLRPKRLNPGQKQFETLSNKRGAKRSTWISFLLTKPIWKRFVILPGIIIFPRSSSPFPRFRNLFITN